MLMQLGKCKTVVWNGPMGVFEFERFANGTFAVAKKLAELTGTGTITIIGAHRPAQTTRDLERHSCVRIVVAGPVRLSQDLSACRRTCPLLCDSHGPAASPLVVERAPHAFSCCPLDMVATVAHSDCSTCTQVAATRLRQWSRQAWPTR